MAIHINCSTNVCRLPFNFLLLASLLDNLIGVHDSIFFFTASKFEICNLNSQSHVKPPKIFTLLWELLPEVLEFQSHLYIAHCILKSVKYIQRFLYLLLKFTIYCRAILQHVGYCGVSNFRFSPRYTWYYTRNDILFRFKEIKNVSFGC